MLSGSAPADTDGRLGLFDARISPDGTRAAFTWAGDVWIADLGTGSCTRLTDNVAFDHNPAWFPDGRRIAFSSNRDGNDDVYSAPVAGGEPTRHTWHGADDVVMDVAPDGEHILFRSARELHSYDIYEVDTHGGLEHAITKDTSRNFEARYSPDGSSIVVSRGIFDWKRRFYHGSADPDLYVMDRDGRNMRWVENAYDGLDYWPAYGPGGSSIYFVSDRDGCENVYGIPAAGGPAVQLTAYRDRPVQFLSVSPTGRVLYVQDFKLRSFQLPEGSEISGPMSAATIELSCATETKRSQEVRLDIADSVTEMEISPTGAYLALIVRGDLFVVPLHDPDQPAPLGDTRYWEAIRVTETPSREQYVAWHPDGDRVALVSDRDGNQEVYEIDLRTKEWTRITRSAEEEWMPKYSPDGTKLAYYRGNTDLIVRDLASGAEHKIAHDLFVFLPFIGPFGWSPDNRFIAFTGNDQVYTGEVFIAPIQPDGTGEAPVNITRHHDNDEFAGWASDRKSLYFLSRRDAEMGLEGYGWWRDGQTLYSVPLRSLPAPRSDVLEFPDDNGQQAEQSSVVTIDFERIEERAIPVSPTRGGGSHAVLSPDCTTYVYESSALGQRALWSVGFEGGKATRIADTPEGVDDVEWIPDNRGVIFLSGGKLRAWIKGSGEVLNVPTTGRLTVDLRAERHEMVMETGRMLRNHFYDANMHGIDWDRALGLYAPLAEDAATPEEFYLLIMELLGELNASHLGCYGPGSSEGIGANVAELGLEFDPGTSGPGLHVTYVLPRGPADYADTKVQVGEWVMKIDGTDVSTSMNYWSLLDDLASRTTVLTVAPDQTGANAREVAIGPIPHDAGNRRQLSWSSAEYKAWADGVRQHVDEVSGGRVGYVHIPYMGGGPLEEFAREVFAENAEKEALIIDIRWNGGGNIHENLLDILSRPQFAWSEPRDGSRIQQPSRRWGRPTVLLINERSTSDSEIFPDGFRALHLGTIIGEATAGAVIGTEEFTLIDGRTGIRLPMEGWYTLSGANMENLGIQPDIRVVNDLNDIRDGIDDQLDTAVQYLLERL
jgi:tricorn protease